MPLCPICGKESRPRAENPATPFCSARCKTVDLGKWLNEEYRVPTNEAPEEAEPFAQLDAGGRNRGDA